MTQSPLTPLGELKNRHSSKWRRYAPDVLPMHVAEMDYDIAQSIRDLLGEMVSNSDLGYTGPVPEVAAGFVSFAQDHWGWSVDSTQVRISTDVGVSAISILRALGKAGVNIAGMQVSRREVGGMALMALTVDDHVSENILEDVKKTTGADLARTVDLEK